SEKLSLVITERQSCGGWGMDETVYENAPLKKKLSDRIPRPKKKVTWPQARAFSVHLLTASGSFLAFLSLVAAAEKQWTAMFLWLRLALVVDGIDVPIARKLFFKEVLPT